MAGFFGAAVLLALAPGPDNWFVLSQSALRGAKGGLIITAGLCTGLVAHTAAVAFGVAALLQTHALAFTALKWAGAAYLMYLAWGAFKEAAAGAAAAGGDDGRGGEKPAPLSLARYYGRGVLMNISNPKVTLFFLAFLPQFTSPERGAVGLQIMLLGALFMGATALVFGAIALAAARVGGLLFRSARARRRLNICAGAVFLALALAALLA